MRIFFLLILAMFVSACSSTHHTVYSKDLQSCFNHLITFKQEVKRQQVRDGQVINDKTFPYLAFDRFSQSQLQRIETENDRRQWLDYTSQLATHQRQAEFNNLIINPFDLPVLDYCADKLTEEAKHNDRVWEQINQQQISVADSYEPWLRIFGLYPLSSRVAQSSIDKEKKRILLGFSEDGFNEPDSRTRQYQIAQSHITQSQITQSFAQDRNSGRAPLISQVKIEEWFNDALMESTIGWPMLSDNQISRLYHYYSPLIKIENRTYDDIPGTVRYLANEQQPAVDPSKPAIYLHHSYTQLYGKTYLQLNYSLWFANRTPTSSFDPYAGKFDGVLLRLTLDHQGRPLLLDSIHHCGCYHMVFNLTDRFEFNNPRPDVETPLMFQRLVPTGSSSWSVTLSHGEHMIKQLGWYDQDPATEAQSQPLKPVYYDQLRQLPTSKKHSVSLFDQRGMLPSSERLESTYLWLFGIPSAGAMRQLGHHAIAFVGIRHFDEPKLFEQIIRPVEP